VKPFSFGIWVRRQTNPKERKKLGLGDLAGYLAADGAIEKLEVQSRVEGSKRKRKKHLDQLTRKKEKACVTAFKEGIRIEPFQLLQNGVK